MALSADERRSIEEELVKTKVIASGVVETIAVVNDVMAQLRDHCYETMAEIRSAADKLILEVRSSEEKLLEKVTEILEWKEVSLKQQKKTLEDYLTELQQSIDYTSDILNKSANQEISEWKTALSAQLQSLQKMKDDYIRKPDIDDGTGFIFLYDNEQLLKSIANFGSVVENVKLAFDYGKKEGKGMSGIPVIPVITLNGLIVDLVEEEKKKYNYDDIDSSDDEEEDDEDDDESVDEESDTGASDYEHHDDDDDNDDDDDDDEDDDDDDDDDIKSNDIPLAKVHKPVGDSHDAHVNLRQNDDAIDRRAKNEQDNDSDRQKTEKTMVGPKTNKGQKLSTLL